MNLIPKMVGSWEVLASQQREIWLVLNVIDVFIGHKTQHVHAEVEEATGSF